MHSDANSDEAAPLSVAVTMPATVAEAAASLGDAPVHMDETRYAACASIDAGRRQVCWAHLIRDFTRISQRAGQPGRIGQRPGVRHFRD